MEHTELVLWNLSQGRVSRRDDRENVGKGDEGDLRATILAGDGNTAQPAAGELFDFRPGQLALLIAPRGLLASDLGQIMGGLDGLGIVAQHLCRQQQWCDVQIALDLCLRQVRHHSRSVAAGSALAFCTGVIVFRTIPTSHFRKTPR